MGEQNHDIKHERDAHSGISDFLQARPSLALQRGEERNGRGGGEILGLALRFFAADSGVRKRLIDQREQDERAKQHDRGVVAIGRDMRRRLQEHCP